MPPGSFHTIGYHFASHFPERMSDTGIFRTWLMEECPYLSVIMDIDTRPWT
jgi:hypothetical protein